MSTLKVDTIQKADGTGSLSVPAESGTVVTTASPSLGRRNILLNGDFRVSQRGDYSSATSIGSNNYFLDRWKTWSGGTGAAQQVTHTTATINGTLRNVCRIEATASWTGHLGVHQVVEQDSSTLNRSFPEGCNLTASVWIRSNNSYARLRNNWMISGYTGIDNTTTHTGDGQWEYHTWTIDTTGRTQNNPVIGVICYDNADIAISSGDYIEIADFQLEVGSVATPFEHRSYGEELALCQRYYYKHTGGTTYTRYGVGENVYAYQTQVIVSLPTDMRAKPTLHTTGTAGDYALYHKAGIYNLTSISLDNHSSKHTAFINGVIGTSSLVQGGISQLMSNNNTSAFLAFDAEL